MGNSRATASLTLGIIGIFTWWLPIIGWIPIILAIVFGISALKKHARQPTTGGEAPAIAGIILGGIGAVFALVALPVIGAMAYFGALSPQKFLPDKCTITGPFSCHDWAIDSNGEIRFSMTNHLGVGADGVFVELKTEDCVLTDDKIMIGHIDNRDDFSVQFGCAGLKADNFVEADITVTYQRLNEMETHNAYGTIMGRVE